MSGANRVLQCPRCGCERTEKELLPGLYVNEVDMNTGEESNYHIPDKSRMPPDGEVYVTCPECKERDWWNDTKIKYKGENEMTNWNDYDKAKDEAKSYVTFPDNVDVFVGLQEGEVTVTKMVDDQPHETKKTSGTIEILKEGEVKESLVGKAQFWALTDFYGATEAEVKASEKEFSTLSAGLIQELRMLDEDGKLYNHIIKIRKIPGATQFQTKYRAIAVKEKP